MPAKGGQEGGAPMFGQVGEKLKVQGHDEDKHVCADDAHREAAEDAPGDTALMGLSFHTGN